MTIQIAGLWLAGALQLVLAGVSFFLPGQLRTEENLSRVSPIIRQIFHMQHNFILFFLLGFAFLCFKFAPEMAGGHPLGTALTLFLALFWSLRLAAQIFYLDGDVKKKFPRGNQAYVAVFILLIGAFSMAAWNGMRP